MDVPSGRRWSTRAVSISIPSCIKWVSCALVQGSRFVCTHGVLQALVLNLNYRSLGAKADERLRRTPCACQKLLLALPWSLGAKDGCLQHAVVVQWSVMGA